MNGQARRYGWPGTAVGTVRVGEIAPGTSSANTAFPTVSGTSLFFRAADSTGSQGRELWAASLIPPTATRDWSLYH